MGYLALVIIFILVIFWKALKAIFRPIFIFIYEMMVDVLMALGISRMAAQAIISVVIILLILTMIF